MAQRLPVVGGDDNDWGSILNGFLGVSHNADGTLSTAAVTAASPSTTASTPGLIQLSGDLGGTATSPEIVSVLGGEIPVTSSSPMAISGQPTTGQVLTGSYTAPGTFPTTGVLDNFTRSSENPLSDGGKWATFTGWTGGNNALEIITSGQAIASVSGGGAALWTATQYTDSEVYTTVEAFSGDTITLFLRIGSPSSFTGYRLKIQNGLMEFYRSDSTSLSSPVFPTIGIGDSVGARIVGTTLTAWHKPSGGSWTQVASATDSTYTSGYIGVAINDQAAAIGNFGGGAVAESISGTWTTPSGGLGNVTLSGTPSSGQVPTATGTTTATWQTPSNTGAVNTFTQAAGFTLNLTQANEVGIITLTSNGTATIPLYASVAFPVGTIIGFVNNSFFTLNISPNGGVTLESPGGTTGAIALSSYGSTAIFNVGTDDWIVLGG